MVEGSADVGEGVAEVEGTADVEEDARVEGVGVEAELVGEKIANGDSAGEDRSRPHQCQRDLKSRR